MNLTMPAVQAGAIGWGALAVASEALSVSAVLTLIFVILAVLSQLMAFGATAKR